MTALCNWPDPSVSEDLLKLAQGAGQAKDQLRALQAVIRINTTQPTDRPEEQRLASLAVLKKAMELASRDEDAQGHPGGDWLCPPPGNAVLCFALPGRQEPEPGRLQNRGGRPIPRCLREPNQAEFNKVLDRVIALCKDKGLVDRARQYREGR